MPFRPKPKQPEFASLKGILSQIKHTDNALYQTIQILIERLMQFQGITIDDIADINASINDINSVINIIADKFRTYITETNETLNLPNSRRLIAGTNITFDVTNPGQFRINASGGGASVDHVPLCLGGEPLEFMSDGDGSSILIEYTP